MMVPTVEEKDDKAVEILTGNYRNMTYDIVLDITVSISIFYKQCMIVTLY